MPRHLIGSPVLSMDVAVLVCPESTIMGIELIQHPRTPVTAFVAAGPAVTQTPAILPENLA